MTQFPEFSLAQLWTLWKYWYNEIYWKSVKGSDDSWVFGGGREIGWSFLSFRTFINEVGFLGFDKQLYRTELGLPLKQNNHYWGNQNLDNRSITKHCFDLKKQTQEERLKPLRYEWNTLKDELDLPSLF